MSFSSEHSYRITENLSMRLMGGCIKAVTYQLHARKFSITSSSRNLAFIAPTKIRPMGCNARQKIGRLLVNHSYQNWKTYFVQ